MFRILLESFDVPAYEIVNAFFSRFVKCIPNGDVNFRDIFNLVIRGDTAGPAPANGAFRDDACVVVVVDEEVAKKCKLSGTDVELEKSSWN